MKSVLITGVCGGIGRATASHLAETGWRVFGVDIEPCTNENELESFWQGDVANEDLWVNTLVPALREVGLKGLVNNAAVQPCTPIQDTSIEEWNHTLSVNLGAAFLATKHLASMLATNGGAIVNVSSVHAVATSPGMAAYVASKGGISAFTRASALELAPQGVRVNAVLPGAIDTRMLQKGLERTEGSAAAKDQLCEKTPLGRVAGPGEVSKTIAFLLESQAATFITGQSVVVDGGVLSQLSSESD